MSTKDGECSGRPKEAVIDENIKKVHKIMLNDRKVKLIEIADIVKISSERVHHIIHEYFYKKKLRTKWVQRELTIDQKHQLVNDSEQCLKLFKRNKPEFSRRYETMDETWLHHFTSESNRQSAECTAHDEPNPKRGNTQQSAAKDEIVKKRLHFKKKKVLFYQDNAPCHKSMKTMEKLHELGFELLPHPPYSPDLAPSDFFLFSDLKRTLTGKKFSTNEEVIAETEAYFEAKDKSYYKNGIEKLEVRYNRCIALEGNYVE
ncbi:Hypothetical protein CINCED_3A010488 [Cinara cedri]|uniref:Tc1-like transposase DDE domain-containing protein n=1 Tax=Cinara cedri TaxID=506608 RepID=A0A5E4N8U6_9HEMI|nr:Hypothetical protein CINCED_3A010488 [Cinara cedri]